DRRGERTHRHPAQEQDPRVELGPTHEPESIHQRHRAYRPDERREREGPGTGDMEGDGYHRAEPGATRETEQERVRERITDQRLESDARDAARTAHEQRERRTRQRDLADGRAGHS